MSIISKMKDAGVPDYGIIAFLLGVGLALGYALKGFFG